MRHTYIYQIAFYVGICELTSFLLVIKFGALKKMMVHCLDTGPYTGTILLQCRYMIRYEMVRHTKCQYGMKLYVRFGINMV